MSSVITTAIIAFISGGIIGLILGYNVAGDDRDMMAKEIERLCVEVDRWKKKAMEKNING